MFNIFKKEEVHRIIGTIERIGVTPEEEYSLKYVVKLKEHSSIYTCELDESNVRKNELALTEKGDEVSFDCNKDNEFKAESFKNVTFPVH